MANESPINSIPTASSSLASIADECQRCGACCAAFRVDFSIYEWEPQGGKVPEGFAEEFSGNTCRMRGTDYVPIRCAALTGKIGEKVGCGIYEWCPSPCRELEPGSYGCEKARARHGLSPLAF